jgi:hypothetical protein
MIVACPIVTTTGVDDDGGGSCARPIAGTSRTVAADNSTLMFMEDTSKRTYRIE